jgi:hypothetical protein
VPEVIRIEKNSIVEFKLVKDSAEFERSEVYQGRARSHMLYFDQIGVESPKLELSGGHTSFVMNFTDAGKFTYECLIYSRMRGCIEVMDDKEMNF